MSAVAATVPAASAAAGPAGSPWVPRPYRVASVRHELVGTVTLELVPEAEPLPPCRPGQFTMLWVPGIGEVPISVSGLARPGTGDDPHRLAQTIRAVGTVTDALAVLRPGDHLGVRGPYGTAWDLDALAGRDVLVIAGGLGLAPLRPAVHRLLDERDRFGRVEVLVGARSPHELLFVDELEAWRHDGRIAVRAIVDRARPGWPGRVGVVTQLLDEVAVGPAPGALVCGPEVMMRVVAAALVAGGVGPGDVQVSLERNMSCGVGLCGHCQLGPLLVCRDGPVVPWNRVEPLVRVRER